LATPAVFGLLATFDLEELVVQVVVTLFDNFDSLFCTVFWENRLVRLVLR